jgi:hypothetical protein
VNLSSAYIQQIRQVREVYKRVLTGAKLKAGKGALKPEVNGSSPLRRRMFTLEEEEEEEEGGGGRGGGS